MEKEIIKVIKFEPKEIEIEVDKLTDTQREYVRRIEKYKKENGESPTIRTIAKLVGVVSSGTVFNMLEALRVKGYDYKETYADYD